MRRATLLGAALSALLLLCPTSTGAALPVTTRTLHVDCGRGEEGRSGAEKGALGTADAPFRSVHQAQAALRALRRTAAAELAAVVRVTGVCELASALALGPADSNTRYVGAGAGATLSGGTRIELPASPGASSGGKVQLYTGLVQTLGHL
jgi:hypothetical protein